MASTNDSRLADFMKKLDDAYLTAKEIDDLFRPMTDLGSLSFTYVDGVWYDKAPRDILGFSDPEDGEKRLFHKTTCGSITIYRCKIAEPIVKHYFPKKSMVDHVLESLGPPMSEDGTVTKIDNTLAGKVIMRQIASGFHKGSLHGIQEFYDATGRLMRCELYDRHKLVEEYIYARNGKKTYIFHADNTWKVYDEQGTELTRGVYTPGMKIGHIFRSTKRPGYYLSYDSLDEKKFVIVQMSGMDVFIGTVYSEDDLIDNKITDATSEEKDIARDVGYRVIC